MARAGRLSTTLWQRALPGEFFVHGLNEFVDVEGFFEDTTGAKEFRDVEKVAVALRAVSLLTGPRVARS